MNNLVHTNVVCEPCMDALEGPYSGREWTLWGKAHTVAHQAGDESMPSWHCFLPSLPHSQSGCGLCRPGQGAWQRHKTGLVRTQRADRPGRVHAAPGPEQEVVGRVPRWWQQRPAQEPHGSHGPAQGGLDPIHPTPQPSETLWAVSGRLICPLAIGGLRPGWAGELVISLLGGLGIC